MKLSKLNPWLLAVIVAINLYVIGLPIYSLAVFWWQRQIERQPAKLAAVVRTIPVSPQTGQYSQGEHLIIPAIALNDTINEGPSVRTLSQGVWHWPKGASPGEVGNAVLIGHRWTYAHNGHAVFEHLDLVKKNDEITIVWQGHKFSYTVTGITVIKPTDTSIIQPTNDKRLTLYTCTPMWSTKNRLAIVAQEDKT